MRNEAWLYLFCPEDWQIEAPIRYKIHDKKKTIIPDVKYRDSDGILNAVEIDRTQMMNVNSEKMNRYGEFTVYYKTNTGKVPIIHFLHSQHIGKNTGTIGCAARCICKGICDNRSVTESITYQIRGQNNICSLNCSRYR